MIVEKIRDSVLLVLALLAVSYGFGWGFRYMRKTAAQKQAARSQVGWKALEARERRQKEVEGAKKRIREAGPCGLDAVTDDLFR